MDTRGLELPEPMWDDDPFASDADAEEDRRTPRPLGMRRRFVRVEVTDPDVIAELDRREPGDREVWAAAALRIGALCLRTASGQVDQAALQGAGTHLVRELGAVLDARADALSERLSGTLGAWLDPASGALPERLRTLVSSDGELERLLRAHLGDQSTLARTLASHVGAESPLFKLVAPGAADGLRAQLERALAEALEAQRQRVLRELSLDVKDSALCRMIGELKTHQGALEAALAGRVDAVVGELTLDRPDSAISRLVGRVEAASREIGKNLTLDEEGSALSRLRRELAGTLDALVQKQSSFQAEVRETLAALDARKKEAERSTRHGATFEEALGALLAAEVQRTGDVCEAVGTRPGEIARCKTGDFVIELGPESAAAGARLVVEAKEDRSYDPKKALSEMDEARKNRRAQLGLFVASARTSGALEPIARHGDTILVVWDPEDPATDLRVRLALGIARALATRARSHDQKSTSALAEIDRAVRAIEKQASLFDEMRGWTRTIDANADKLLDRLGRMEKELGSQLERLDAHVAQLRTAEPPGP